MNSFVSWVGGKKLLRDAVVQHLPFNYDTYIEVFGGGGWVLFHKPVKKGKEIYNDYNGLLVNLFRCVQCKSKAARMKKLLEYSLNSRQEFDRIRQVLNNPEARMPDYRRAAYYYQLIRYSYSSGLSSFGGRPHNIRGDFPIIDLATKRLEHVIVEHKDFQSMLTSTCNKAGNVYYCDPPYHDSEGFYKNVGEGGFTLEDHFRLRDTVTSEDFKAKVLISYNDDEFIRDLYSVEGFYMLELKRLFNMKQRFEGGAQFPELLIANYDLFDSSQLFAGQSSLF